MYVSTLMSDEHSLPEKWEMLPHFLIHVLFETGQDKIIEVGLRHSTTPIKINEGF